MSVLQPVPIKLDLSGCKLELLCTISAMDYIEETFNIKFYQITSLLLFPDNLPSLLHFLDISLTPADVIMENLNDENILIAYESCARCIKSSFPQKQDFPEDDDESGENTSEISETRLSKIIAAGLRIGIPYNNVLNMTIRQLLLLIHEYVMKSKPSGDAESIDDMIP